MKVLAISVHPDDETLGCGGTLLQHAYHGDELHWMIFTQGFTPEWSAAMLSAKEKEIARVAQAYGMASIHRLGLPATRLDTVPQVEMMHLVREALAAIHPKWVYLVHDGDVHTDHHAAFSATMSVMKTFYMRQQGIRRIMSYETLSSTEAAAQIPGKLFVPNSYRDITDTMERKLEVMSMFATETQDDPMPRGPSAIRALARYRGASISADYAEAFMLIREVL